MIYEYWCEGCGKSFDVIKKASDMERQETCEACKAVAKRVFIPRSLYFIGTKVEEAEYNPGLGCIVKNAAHRKEITKARGLTEIGSEKPETVHKHFDEERKRRYEKSWEDATRGWVGEG